MVDICLATYNGERFLEEQMDSIINQSYPSWHLWIRDDGSSDSTLQILNDYSVRYPDKISIIYDNKGNLGFIQNFNEILKYTTAVYIAFSDQDDIWKKDKLKVLITELRKHDSDTPLFIHSDFSYINEKSEIIEQSFVKFSNKHPVACNNSIIRSIFFGLGVGCTAVISRALYDSCGEIPKSFPTGHDHWFLFGAILTGEVVFINKILITHRVHSGNTCPKLKKKKVIFQNVTIQKKEKIAGLLLDNYNDLTKLDCWELHKCSKMLSLSLIEKVYFFFKSGLFFTNQLKNCLYVLINLTIFKENTDGRTQTGIRMLNAILGLSLRKYENGLNNSVK